ncbi:MAG: penicillin-binding protein 2 [Acidimicrobiia bacterium]|nr:penicillin-binding protein 2 [Acidimicrobiia bacterium]
MKPGWRLAVLGLVFGALFSVLTLRLWYLQVTEAATLEVQAERQQIRLVTSLAPRGEILDRDGRLLAGSRSSLSLVVDTQLLPEDRLDEVIQAVATLLDLAPVEVRARLNDAARGALAPIATDIDAKSALFIMEHGEDFPGLRVERVPVRTYPAGESAAHVVGYIGRPNDADLELPGVEPGDAVGKFGVEKAYEVWLRGTPGLTKYGVNAEAEILSINGEQPPEPGGSVRTTIDLEFQAVLENALVDGIKLARSEETRPEVRDAIRASGVVLDVTDGSILAMASAPSFDPSIFVGGLTQAEWTALQDKGAFNNFVIQGTYPPASTFKVVGYAMALEEGVYPQAEVEQAALQADSDGYFCSGQLEFQFNDGSPNVFNDWKADGHGTVNLHGALQQSCDLYFWELALRVWRAEADEFDEDLIQQWARRLGFGERSGIDLPFEQQGLIPDREWFNRTQQETPGRVRQEGAWSGGDVMNIVLGQGAVTATPLQVANAYAALVNGGTLWEPRVVTDILDRDGVVIFENPAKPIRQIELDPQTALLLRADLRQVVNGPAGTARAAFVGFGAKATQIGGKTGTAEVKKGATSAEDIDTAWFIGVTPIDDPRYVVAVVVEQGGSGGRIAAPTAAQVLKVLVGEAPGEVTAGEDTD